MYTSNMHGYISRKITSKIIESIKDYPVVALLGARQVGKSTLAKAIQKKIKNSIYLDLEKPSHIAMLQDPEVFFENNKKAFICLDEIQRLPEIFSILRSVVDERGSNKQFLILGSASKELIKQSSESLAGRIAYLDITPFSLLEIGKKEVNKLWLRGGYPKSFLFSVNAKSLEWRLNYIKSFLEQDIPQLGFNIATHSMRRLWSMLAHNQGQVLNSSKLASSLGVSSHTVNAYMEILQQTFLLTLLRPYETNLKKRLIKSPKIYIRDTGLLHALLNIESMNDLLGHPVYGSSYEGFVIENIMTKYYQWQFSYYRTQSGAEIDLIMTKGNKKIAIEIKTSKAPVIPKGFWLATKELGITERYIIAQVNKSYMVKEGVRVLNLWDFLNRQK